MAEKTKKTRKGKKPNYKQGWETRRRNAALAAATKPSKGMSDAALARIETAAGEFVNRAATSLASQQAMAAGLAPATGPEPESEFAIKARAIIVAARKKGGQEAIEQALTRAASQAAFEATERLAKLHVEQLKAVRETNAINVVAAFMAEIEAIGALNRGPLPPAVMFSGFTIARVSDALSKAGYSKNGFRQPDRREEIMNRSHP